MTMMRVRLVLTLTWGCMGPSLAQDLATIPIAILTPAGIHLQAGTQRQLLPETAGAETFGWDHGGRHLLITRDGKLLRVPIAGGKPELVAEGFGNPRFPEVSPDGERIALAVATAKGRNDWSVLILDRESGGRCEIGSGYDPTWSADGTKLYFERTAKGTDLMVIDLASGKVTPIFEERRRRHTVQCSPSGRYLTWTEEGRLMIRDARTGVVKALGRPGVYDRFASFAPDEESIVFFRDDASKKGESIIKVTLANGQEEVIQRGRVLLAAHAPPSRRRLADFVAISRRNQRERSIAELSGLSATPDGRLLLWVQRSAAAAESEPHGAPLFLSGVKILSPGEAAALARWKGDRIFLPDLRALDVVTARALTGGVKSHELYLDGVEKLSRDVAAALVAKPARRLSFGSLASLNTETAETLAGFGGGLLLDGLRELPESLAIALARWTGSGEYILLSLNGVKKVTPEAMTRISALRGWGLSLGGLKSLSPDLARRLRGLRVPFLALDGLESLDPITARVMATWERKFLHLGGLASISPEARSLVEKGCKAAVFRGLAPR